MQQKVLLDTGPLVALLNRHESRHSWARNRFAEIRPPLLTCEPVLTEAAHLLRRVSGGPQALLAFIRRGVVEVPFVLEQEAEAIERLMTRYLDQPMSLADACLVRMAEIHSGSSVLTLDSDFKIYRMHGRRVIPAMYPS